jgi:hypothetical protein
MQRVATKLKDVEQLSLLPAKAASRPVSLDRIYTLTDTHDALLYACELARLVPKKVAPLIGVDKTVWSRITTGEFDLDGRDIYPFDTAIGNDAYLLYLNHIHGYDLASLRKVQSDSDKRIAELESENRDLRRAMTLWVEAQKAGR